MEDLVSVIIPVYNSQKTIIQCVNSVIKQTYSNIEILLIDDGSTDQSKEICEKLSKQDSRIKVICKSNGGPASARNAGIQKALGNYIVFVDSDDYIHEDMCNILLKFAKKENADIVCCDYSRNNQYYLENKVKDPLILDDNESIIKDYYANFNIKTCIWNKLYKKDIVMYFNENLIVAEDALFTCNILTLCKKLVYIPITLYNYSTNNESITRSELSEKKILDELYSHEEQIKIIKHRFRNDLVRYPIKALFNSIFVLISQNGNEEYNKLLRVKLKEYYMLYKHFLGPRFKLKALLVIYFKHYIGRKDIDRF